MTRHILSFIVPLIICGTAVTAQASWYWPFGDDDSSTNKPPRLHVLLEKANDFIELGEDAAREGDSEKALQHYRAALDELARVESENPERAETAEFAPLRNKAAACQAAIDSIRFEQVNRNTRAVAVTDTSELQRKWRRNHGLETDEDRAARLAPKQAPKKAEPAPKPMPEKTQEKTAAKADTKKADAQTADTKKTQDATDPKLQSAMDSLREKNYAAADIQLEALMREKPGNLNILLLRAAAQAGTGSYNAARRTLERAMRAHPKSPLPYYNLAHLYLKLGNDLENARQYYELNLEFDGPRSPSLEAKLSAGGKKDK